MMRDMEGGGPTEADHILGDLIQRGEAANVPCPLLRLASSAGMEDLPDVPSLSLLELVARQEAVQELAPRLDFRQQFAGLARQVPRGANGRSPDDARPVDAGADGVVIPERRAVGLTDTVAKSSAGAIEYVKVAKTANLNRFIEDLKERNIWVVGTSGNARMDYTEWDWTRPSALVLGAEGTGLHRLVAENCDILVKIPMYGKIDSLNVSVAAGVILFEARRQRDLKRE